MADRILAKELVDYAKSDKLLAMKKVGLMKGRTNMKHPMYNHMLY